MKKFKIHTPCNFQTVFFGNYIIPNCIKPMWTYVKNPIEWLVLDVNKDENKALLLSKYALDWELFAISCENTQVSWESSYLRKWLNDGFYNACFDAEEHSAICPTFITPESGNAKRTLDNIFLLSEKEVEKYFTTEESARTYDFMLSPSDGDKEEPHELSYEPCFWWTRTPGSEPDLVVCVDPYGFFDELELYSDEVGVRPAMWVKL